MPHYRDANAMDVRQRNAHAVARLLDKAHGQGKASHVSATAATPPSAATRSRAMPDVARHVGRQLELATAMGTLTPAEHDAMLAKSVALATASGACALHVSDGGTGGVGDAHTSCLAMQLCIARHGMQLRGRNDDSAKDDDKGRACTLTRSALLERRRARQRAVAVRRYEQTLPRRRAVDAYVNLTVAQVAASARRPSTHTADVLAARYGGRWPLNNAHHQQLLDGVPVMSRILRGEYYEQPQQQQQQVQTKNNNNSSSSDNNSRAVSWSRPRHCPVDFIAANKQRVHAMSERNASAHTHMCTMARTH